MKTSIILNLCFRVDAELDDLSLSEDDLSDGSETEEKQKVSSDSDSSLNLKKSNEPELDKVEVKI